MFHIAQVKEAIGHFSCGRAENRHPPMLLAPDGMELWVTELFQQLLKIFYGNHVVFQSLPIACES